MTDTRRVGAVGRPVEGVVRVPGSKSIANRALVCAALAEGTSTVAEAPDGDDTAAMVGCLRSLGLDVVEHGGAITVGSSGPVAMRAERTLHAGLAGTTSRFVTALAALATSPITVDGDPPLRRRPFAPLQQALVDLGVRVDAPEGFGHLPATVTGPPSTGTTELRGDVSSQFVSALMMIGPYLPNGLDLRLTSPLVSRPYVDLTAAVMAWFGGEAVVAEDHVAVRSGTYTATDVVVEPDASSASYPLALAAVTAGTVTVSGLGRRSLQGDARFAALLADMGCIVDHGAGHDTTVTGSRELRGVDVDMADISDLVPTMAVVAACATTPTRIRGVGFIRHKESDRLGDLAVELRRAGVDVEETADGLDIRPSRDRLRPARFDTHHDHRLAMAFAVLGCVAGGVEVVDPGVVSKSWPGFWTTFDQLVG